MSELAAGSETLPELKARHAKEVGDVKFQGRQRVKAAKAVAGSEQASAIATAKAENEQAEAEVEYRHARELEALEEADPDAFAAAEEALLAQQEAEKAEGAAGSSASKGSKKKGSKNGGGVGDASASGSSETAQSGGDGKKSKAAKKREKELAKEREREARIAAEKAGAGPTPRELESAAIAQRIGQGSSTTGGSSSGSDDGPPPFPPLKVHEVLSDGHCLYRSVAHQLLLRGDTKKGGENPPPASFQALRQAAAEEMRCHRDEYAPFLDLEPLAQVGDSDEAVYERYCARVAESAEWGGHPELLALSKALQLPLRVHSATPASEQGPLMVGWEEFGGHGAVQPLELTYHRHFYALGEHYNSTEPI